MNANAAHVTIPEESWIDVREAAHMFGMTAGAIKNAILEKRFPVDTYKLGKRHVIDRDVLQAFFASKKERGMKRINEGPPPVQRPRRVKK